MNNKKMMYVFLLLLPFIDLVTSLITRFNLISISLGMVVKGLFLLVMLYYLIVKSTSKHKNKSLIYLGIIFVYIILYFFTKRTYMSNENLITEMQYIFKLMYMPILLPTMVCYFDDKNFSKRELKYILCLTCVIYGLLLFIPYITHTGFKTYNSSLQGDTGWFFSGNEISIILILIYPFTYILLKRKNILFVLVPILTMLIISTIGTKASMIGLLIDTLVLFIISLFIRIDKNKKKKLIISSFIILALTTVVFLNSKSLNNMKITFGIQQVQDKKQKTNDAAIEKKRLQERKLIKEEIKKLSDKKEEKKDTKFIQISKALLSDRDIYFKVTNRIYEKNYSTNTLLFGLGFTNNEKIKSFAITKLIEIDPLDIFFHAGLIALLIILTPFMLFVYEIFRNKKINSSIVLYVLMLGMVFCVSWISGHTLMAPAVSIYIVLYFILAYGELKVINNKDYNIEKGKISIYALHLNYGGVEKNICMKANILSEIYNVEIITLYKLQDKPQFELDKKVKVKYLTENIKPNKKEFLSAVQSKNIFKILKEGIYAVKVLYLKDTLIRKSMTNCNSEIIISTRVDFSEKLIKCNEYNNIKIAEEHIYHNNNLKYLNKLYKLLKYIDYLMPSSKYLCDYYKDIFNDYSYKIITNNMPIETNNKKSSLKNKTIISVGRLDKIKGYEDLINIFAKINDKEWTLQIVGDGPEYNNLKSQIRRLNMEDNIKLLGFKSPKELNTLYKDSSIYVMTSLEESFGLVLVEAASHGLPIIAYSSALGAKEILSGNNGILVDNRDETKMIETIKEMMYSDTLRKDYQKRSLSIAEIYSYDKIKEDNINFFKNIKKSDMYKNLYTGTKDQCYKLIEKKLKNEEKQFIITANPETYMLSKINKTINDMLYDSENLIVPDGISIVKTANFLGYDLKGRITGVDLAEHLLEVANKKKYKVYLFGASEQVMDKLTNVIKEKYPNIDLVGSTNGYVKDKDSVMNYMKIIKPDIVMLALGIPLQEKLIYNHIRDFDKGIFIGVGGSFDVLSGEKKRAPKMFIKFNLEWLYRIASEPKRLMRFIKHNIRFIGVILKEKLYKSLEK